jgi:hypothetical protein
MAFNQLTFGSKGGRTNFKGAMIFRLNVPEPQNIKNSAFGLEIFSKISKNL